MPVLIGCDDLETSTHSTLLAVKAINMVLTMQGMPGADD